MKQSTILQAKWFLLVLIVLLGMMTYSIIGELRKRYSIEQEVAALQEQITKLENRNDELAALTEYLQSPEYHEKEIRRKLSLQKPGEHVVAMPNAGILTASTSHPVNTDTPKTYWRAWWDYFFKN